MSIVSNVIEIKMNGRDVEEALMDYAKKVEGRYRRDPEDFIWSDLEIRGKQKLDDTRQVSVQEIIIKLRRKDDDDCIDLELD